MKRIDIPSRRSILIALIAIGSITTWAGDLSPPAGPVGPTPGPEPRIPINLTNTPGDADSLFKITQPGSYYLTGNMAGVAGKHGIEISVSGVTVDLNGFDMVGVVGSLDGVTVTFTSPLLRNITVHNGSVGSWSGVGINLYGAFNTQVRDILSADNGGGGVHVGNANCALTRCCVFDNGVYGISAVGSLTCMNCTAMANVGNGFDAGSGSTFVNCLSSLNDGTGFDISGSTISDCSSYLNGENGIAGGFSSTVVNCNVTANNAIGIEVLDRSTVSSCVTTNNIESCLSCRSGCIINNNTCYSSDADAIHVAGDNNRIENNLCLNADRGIAIIGTRNHVINNTVRSNTDNYEIAHGNHLNLIISDLPELIDWPATLTLAGDLTGASGQNGLTINADGVTIDLAGHGLIGVGGSLAGISVPATRKNLTVKNGRIASWGGLGVSGTNADSSLFADLLVTSNGGGGVLTGDGCSIDRVIAESNTGDGVSGGVSCLINRCIARSNSARGLAALSGAVITDSDAYANGTIGINPDVVSVVTRCMSRSNGTNGVETYSGSRVSDCTIGRNVANGIQVSSGVLVLNNSCQGNGNAAGDGANIFATGSDNRIEGNNCTGADRGIDIAGAGNIVVRNTCSGNTLNWEIAASNAVAPIVQASTNAAAISGNTYVGSLGSTDPHANFTY